MYFLLASQRRIKPESHFMRPVPVAPNVFSIRYSGAAYSTLQARRFRFSGSGKSTARIASSKTLLRPFCVSAEHSRYLEARTSLAMVSPWGSGGAGWESGDAEAAGDGPGGVTRQGTAGLHRSLGHSRYFEGGYSRA